MRRTLLVFVLALVTLPSFAITRTWTGAQSANWSNPANWSPQGLPAPEDTLVFPGTNGPVAMINDLPDGTIVGPMNFGSEGSLTGNALTLTGNLSFVSSPSAVPFTFSVDLILGASITIYQSYGKSFNGALDVNGRTLTFSPAYSTVIRGPIRGTGTILVNGTGLNVTGSGSFSGTIDGRANVDGSYPNARIRSPRFSGDGTVGAVHAGLLYPGDAPPLPSQGGEHEIATLRTGSLAIDPVGAKENGGAHNSNPKGRLLIDLDPDGLSDQLQVRGTVSLDASLEVTLLGAPAPGQAFTIIDNDGSDAVNGRFTGLSEGAMFTVGPTTLWISYAGGDGNDVVLNAGTPPPLAKTWTGATSANWSEPSNWSPAGVPVSGDALVFPAGARLTTHNDLSGFVAGPMLFDDDYVLSGNAIALTGDLQFGGSAVDFACHAPLSLRTPLRFQAAGSTAFYGPIDTANHGLTIDTKRTLIRGAVSGTSEIVIRGEGLTVIGDGPFRGRFRGRLDITGAYPDATIDGWTGALSGSGLFDAVAAMTLSPGTSHPWAADSHDGGIIRTRFFSINEEYLVDLHATGASDRVIAAGPIALYSELTVTVHGALPHPSYTIVENTGSDAIYGTFAGLPEGSTFYAGDEKFSISYKGGDGNDVVLDRIIAKAATATALTQSSATTEVNEPVTFTAKVTSSAGMPAGSVTFTDGSTTLGTATLVNGVAELTTDTLAEGTHSIVATYAGSESYESSASAPVVHEVTAGPEEKTATTTTLTQNRETTEVNQPVTFTARVTSSNGVPDGNVTFRSGETSLGTVALQNGEAELRTKDLPQGTHAIVASYSGSETFAASVSAPLTHRVVRGNPHVSITPTATALVHGDTASFRIDLKADDERVPAGRVTLSVDGAGAGKGTLAAGSVTIAVPMLTAGEHTITAAYEGSAEFEPATASITRTVAKAATTLALESDADRAVAGERIDVTIRVTTARPSLRADGKVALWHGGELLAEVALDGGIASARIGPFERGEYALTAAYAGSAGFAASSGALTLRVTEPVASVASQQFDEGNGLHEVAVQIQLIGSSPTPVVMDYRTVDGTAAAGADYEETRGTLVLPPGQSVATVSVRVIGDTQPEPDETFTIELTHAVGARITASSAPIVIRNDEPHHRPPVTYTYESEGGPLQATFYAPLAGSGPWPVILWVPGDRAYDGAGGDVAALALTEHGYAVLAAGYRPAGTAPVRDLEAALRWLRANAAQLNVAPDKIVAWGAGAGGHLAALLGTGVEAVVTWGAITDPATLQQDAPACSTTGWNAAALPSAVAQAGRGNAPALLMHGAADCLVGSRQSERLYEALRGAGVDTVLRIYDGVGHDDDFWTSAEAFAEVSAFLDARLHASPRRRAVRR